MAKKPRPAKTDPAPADSPEPVEGSRPAVEGRQSCPQIIVPTPLPRTLPTTDTRIYTQNNY